MALSRKDFTALAELVGNVEAGVIAPIEFRAALMEALDLANHPTFKPDKFNRHADVAREHILDEEYSEQGAIASPPPPPPAIRVVREPGLFGR